MLFSKKENITVDNSIIWKIFWFEIEKYINFILFDLQIITIDFNPKTIEFWMNQNKYNSFFHLIKN